MRQRTGKEPVRLVVCTAKKSDNIHEDSLAKTMDPMRRIRPKAVSNQQRQDDWRSMRQDPFGRRRASADGSKREMRTLYNTARGWISPALVPILISDALNRHVAVKLAEERLADNGGSGN
jgi:hypothetical protein